MNKYIICSKREFKYFIDYINSINQYLNAKIVYYDNINNLINNKNNILFFIQKINILFKKIKCKFYLINTEQLSCLLYSNIDNDLLNNVKNNLTKYINSDILILDYSKENIDIIKNKLNYKKIYYLPYIYNKNEIINIEKNNDICYIKTDSEYRLNILNKINNIHIIQGFDNKRDKKLFSYKILINISFNKQYNIFEIIRCYRCLFNKMIIISDHKYKEDLIEYKKHILFTDYDNIVKLSEKVLNNYEYYYNLLDLDNIDINFNKVYIKEFKNEFNI